MPKCENVKNDEYEQRNKPEHSSNIDTDTFSNYSKEREYFETDSESQSDLFLD